MNNTSTFALDRRTATELSPIWVRMGEAPDTYTVIHHVTDRNNSAALMMQGN